MATKIYRSKLLWETGSWFHMTMQGRDIHATAIFWGGILRRSMLIKLNVVQETYKGENTGKGNFRELLIRKNDEQ